MSLHEQAKQTLNDFDNTSSEKIVEILNGITGHFKSDLTRDYLQGKIEQISSTNDENEKKKLCKNLIPYLDWYIQGN